MDNLNYHPVPYILWNVLIDAYYEVGNELNTHSDNPGLKLCIL